MKWAKLVKDPDSYIRKATPEQRVCFRFVDQRDLDKEFGVWAHYKFPPDFKISAQGMTNYENFCGGFLLFYDDVVRNAVVDHAIYIKWEPKDKNAKNDGKPQAYESVTMFLSPKPMRKPTDKYPSVRTREQSPIISDHLGALHPDALPATTPAPGFGDDIDPPPPPPPPPPVMDAAAPGF